MLLNTQENNELYKYSEKEIVGELHLILSSQLFARSTVLSNFLKYIVHETLDNRTENLKEYTIAVNALGKSSSFNPQVDAIVRIHAGRLRRLLNEYYTSNGNSNTIRIEVVKGTYVPVFRPRLEYNTNNVSENEKPIKQFSRSKLTLAVLPFRNLCPNNDYQFFVDGFGEELTRIFSNFQEIAVVAHYSTRKYISEPEDIRSIGSDLGAHYLITGSVKRSTHEIRVNICLVKTLDGMQVWSQTYNNPLNLDTLIDIQDQIVNEVCSLLGGFYGIIIHEDSKTHRKTLPSIHSFDAALWNYYFHMNFSLEAYNQTRQALEEAMVQSPNYATGLAMLSELYLDAYSLGFPTVDEPVLKAYELAKKAIKIDPHCQYAYQEFAWANIYLKRKEEAIKAMESCMALNPSSVSAMGAIGFGLACVGEYKRADIMLTNSLDLNPNCPWWFFLGFFLARFKAGRYKEALIYAEKIEVPDVFLDPLTKVLAKAELGMVEEAQRDLKNLTQNFPEIVENLEEHLSSFLLDTEIIEKMVQGIQKAQRATA
ncbi:hypothetical protein QRD02_04130 [Aequorivita sp. SDUM287046]|uniref:Tetratricopeptide repeat protein n=1 Tax=Aequorivita aurantiaca TaxID=3053356 RepID=A0ABT8DEJ0_9FLAO|nr:hypothetical protein [Aequorivita aurantiaca]MDN3723558.1 hypothetical protein [Aequorivita aurantiaca]